MKFVKKPIEIEAFQLTKETRLSNVDWPPWMHEAWNRGRGTSNSLFPTEMGTDEGDLTIMTLEGREQVSFGDYIIQGIQGLLYPCKSDIFDITYDRLDNGS